MGKKNNKKRRNTNTQIKKNIRKNGAKGNIKKVNNSIKKEVKNINEEIKNDVKTVAELVKEDVTANKANTLKTANGGKIRKVSEATAESTTFNRRIKPHLIKFKKFLADKCAPFNRKIKEKTSPAIKKAAVKLEPFNNKVVKPVGKKLNEFYNCKAVVLIRKCIKNGYLYITDHIKLIYLRMLNAPFRTALVLAFISILYVESMSRRSFFDAIVFIGQKPMIFFLNYLIVLAPFLLAIMIRRKMVVYTFFSLLWVLVGTTDYMLLTHRTTPFTGVDLKISRDEITVVFNYLNATESMLLVVGIILALLLILALFIFSKKTECKHGRVVSTLMVIAMWLGIYYSIIVGINTDVLTTKFGNLGISYHDYGMPYCFVVTIVDTGIARPKDYSNEVIDNIVSTEKPQAETGEVIEPAKETKPIEELPNVIFIQLESFIDPMLIHNGITYSEDPIPYYRSLRENYSSGYLTVPTVVAGTCNTEFEVITGMNLGFFGPGEYPYKTILKESTCESMAYDLKALGYTPHAIHNHTSGFYGRNLIYSHFGFDSFTGIEMMHDTSKTANGSWTKDDVLPGCVVDCLNSSEGKDLIYMVTVQSHGTYNSDIPAEEQFITVTGDVDSDLLQQFNYYINQVKQVDNMIKNLITTLSSMDEKYVVVMYGDHIPGLNLSDEMFDDKTIYETEYVIWDNYGLEKKDMNLTSYQIASEVFDRIGIHEGTIFKYHQDTDKEDENYLKGLEYLQYDMLYGQHYVYGGKNPYEATNIRYGVKDIVLDNVTYDGEYLYVSANDKYFSKYSKVFINETRKKTEVIFSNLLRVKVSPEELVDGSVITVHQINALDVEFAVSNEFTYNAADNPYDELPADGVDDTITDNNEDVDINNVDVNEVDMDNNDTQENN
ncbi:MAG: LTA synthase family protein [Lachnospiraceae bacterium]|nr:LTA synthase family protein [Lachnospiraceae bacterium]